MPSAPNPKPRPKLAQFLFDRRLTYRDAAEALDVSYETIRRLCLPFVDPARRVPKPPLMARIQAWTSGEVLPQHFYETALAAVA
ncbi:hypothetical protein [Caulobacter sp. S45]|uniref:hypothetical protein n=1 Tax=Caulobacter sp. S45 TaxID=1641861 RepID=UPI0015775883|nr:hypothetical protein [Caulobacter sp. S45]